MFEDVETVPAGWYPDPMGLPQLRWWNNHAWTELTSEAGPPLMMQTATRLAFADDELPTRRQQREQRERDEDYATLATDEDDARDAAAAYAPLSVTLREIDAPAVQTAGTSKRPADPSVVNLDTIDYDSVASDAGDFDSYTPRSASIPTEGSVLDAPAVTRTTVEQLAGDVAPGDTEFFEALFQPRSADPTGAGSTAQSQRAEKDSRSERELDADFESIPRGRSVSRLPIYTAQVWIIALVPLLLLVPSLLLLLGFGSSLNGWVTPTLWTTSYLAVVILAIADRVALGRAGYEHRASWAWALLTAPIYLLARSMSLSKVGPLGFAPVLVWVALGILQVGSVLVVPGLLISALPQVFTIQAEQSIASDASIIGAKLSVKCSPNLPLLIGQTFDCLARGGPQERYDLTVVLRRSNGWINWHVTDWRNLHGAPMT